MDDEAWKEFENECDDLSVRAADWIVDQLAGYRSGRQAATDLELMIYHWLIEHAIFDR